MGQGANQRLQHRPMRPGPLFGIGRVHRAPGAKRKLKTTSVSAGAPNRCGNRLPTRFVKRI